MTGRRLFRGNRGGFDQKSLKNRGIEGGHVAYIACCVREFRDFSNVGLMSFKGFMSFKGAPPKLPRFRVN